MSNTTRHAQAGIPLAYFITVHTYGTWLPGDARGWVDHHRACKGDGAPASSGALNVSAEALMQHPPLTLSADMRRIVESAIRATCGEAGWTLLALSVRTNHLHALVVSDAVAGQVLSRLKGVASRSLRRSGLVPSNQPVWSKQGSTRYLWRAESVTRVEYYIDEMQDDQSLQMPWMSGG